MAKTIGFDDIDTSGGAVEVASGYKGLNWTNMYTFNPDDYYDSSGYQVGRTSGENVAFNGYADPAGISVSSGTFDFKSVELTAAWDAKLKVEVIGYDANGDVMYDKTVSITDGHASMDKFNFMGVSSVEFMSLKGKADPNAEGAGDHIAFDDFVIGNITNPDAVSVGHANVLPAALQAMSGHHGDPAASMSTTHATFHPNGHEMLA